MKRFTWTHSFALAWLMFGIAHAANYTRFEDVITKNTLSVGSNSAANSKAIADFSSTTKGVLLPRMSTTQQNAISSPTEGLAIYDNVLHTQSFYNGSAWVPDLATATATSVAVRDANANLSANNLIDGYRTTATAAGTTTLVVGDAYQQYFTGSTTQTVKLPVTSTLVLGQQYLIVNSSSGVVTVQSSGTNTLQAMAANTSLVATVILTSGTGTASWSWSYAPSSIALPITVANGGTGLVTLTAHSIQIGNGTSNVTQLGVGITGQILAGVTSADPAFTPTPTIGTAATTGTLGFNGKTSGTVTMSVNDVAGTYTFKLPAAQCSNGQTWLNDGSGNFSCGSAGASGAKNYLGNYNNTNNNGDFELNSVGSWVLGHATMTSNFPSGVPTFGSGASGNALSAIVSGGSQIGGSYSVDVANSVTNVAGDFWASPQFHIDQEDRGKVMQIKFSYLYITGTTNFSGTSSNSYGIAIYDVTNSAWIMPAGVWNIVQNNASVPGLALATFQTPSNGSNFRLVVFNAAATVDAAAMYYDDFFVGPQQVAQGPAITDWVSFTPTASWNTGGTWTGQWRRVGGDMEIQYHFVASGAVTATNLTINMPTGYTIDTAKLANVTASTGTLGRVVILDSGVASYSADVLYKSNSDFYVYIGGASGTYVNYPSIVSNTIPITFGASDQVDAFAKVPISGWSSNNIMSADTDTRVVSFSAYRNTNQTGVNTNNTFVKVAADTVVTDTHSAFNTSTNTYTIPVTGYYTFQGAVQVASSNVISPSIADLVIYKNGSQYKNGGYVQVGIASQVYGAAIATSPDLYNAGDTVALEFYSNSNNSSSTLTFQGSSLTTWFSGQRVTGPAVISGSEVISACYQDTSGQSTTANTTNFTYNTKLWDSHGIYSGGLFTLPVPGKYQVTIAEYATAGTNPDVQLYKNAAKAQGIFRQASTNVVYSGVVMTSGNAGDTLSIRATANTTRGTSSSDMQICVLKVAN